VAAAVAGLALYFGAGRSAARHKAGLAVTVPTVVVRWGNLDQTVAVTGQTTSPRFASIIIPIQRGRARGQLHLTKLASGGSVVRAGDVVAEVDALTLKEQLSDLDDSVSQWEADVRKRKAQQTVEWESLAQNLRISRANAEKAEIDRGAAEVKSPIDREILRLGQEEAEARYRQQREALPLKQISIEADLRVMQLNRERLQVRRDRMAKDLENYTFRAPMDGMVVMGNLNRPGSSDSAQYKVGDQVRPGQVLMKIMQTSSMQLAGAVSQVESRLIQVGQRALVSFDAIPGLRLEGKVQKVGAMAVRGRRESYYVRTVPATVEIQGSDPRLIPDLSGAAEILIDRQENVLVLPLEALFEEGDQDFVYLKTGESFEKHEVEVGSRSNTHAAVLSGLSADQEVATAPPPTEQ
jgi:multidrug efflux pump subunit AcrA (membrane-fusion protein)